MTRRSAELERGGGCYSGENQTTSADVWISTRRYCTGGGTSLLCPLCSGRGVTTGEVVLWVPVPGSWVPVRGPSCVGRI